MRSTAQAQAEAATSRGKVVFKPNRKALRLLFDSLTLFVGRFTHQKKQGPIWDVFFGRQFLEAFSGVAPVKCSIPIGFVVSAGRPEIFVGPMKTLTSSSLPSAIELKMENPESPKQCAEDTARLTGGNPSSRHKMDCKKSIQKRADNAYHSGKQACNKCVKTRQETKRRRRLETAS